MSGEGINRDYNKFDNEPESNSCCKNICSLIGYGLNLSYLIIGIVFLVNDYHINNDCHSQMWTYVLTTICVTVSQVIGRIDESKKYVLTCTFIFGGVYLGLGLWGKNIFESTTCTALLNSELYIWTNVSFIFNLIIGSILLIVFLIVCCIRNSNRK